MAESPQLKARVDAARVALVKAFVEQGAIEEYAIGFIEKNIHIGTTWPSGLVYVSAANGRQAGDAPEQLIGFAAAVAADHPGSGLGMPARSIDSEPGSASSTRGPDIPSSVRSHF